MRKLIVDALIGALLIVVMTLVQFIVSMLFGFGDEVFDDPALRQRLVDRMFLASALPAGIVTAVAVHFTKPATFSAAAVSAGIWVAVLTANHLFVGLTNATASYIFGGYGFYVFLLATGAGPFAYALIRRLPARPVPEGGKADG